MNVALVNPPWNFEGSSYFGCRDAHLPLEYGYTKALLERQGHAVQLVDAQLEGLDLAQVRARVAAFAPALTVVTTAPSYLFWRCPPPELRVPQDAVDALRGVGGTIVAVGPHGSTTPESTLEKLGCDVVVLGECEEVVAELASRPQGEWSEIRSICLRDTMGRIRVQGGPRTTDLDQLPPLQWDAQTLQRHAHHHHRFDVPPEGPGAEIEASRGCPFSCTFCAKETHRDRFRRRPREVVLAELDWLVAQGVRYVYFIDEIFLPETELLEAIARRGVKFGVQTRIDLWTPEQLDLLGRAGCVSIEAGVESISSVGREAMKKRCRLPTEELVRLLVRAKKTTAFVQATLVSHPADDPREVERWRQELRAAGVWANEPVPLFPYPGSPDFTRQFGAPDATAWERAVDHYLQHNDRFSDIQERRPLRLVQLERRRPSHA